MRWENLEGQASRPAGLDWGPTPLVHTSKLFSCFHNTPIFSASEFTIFTPLVAGLAASMGAREIVLALGSI